MRKVIALEHVSLDGYLAGPHGEMGWIRVDDAMWDYVGELTDSADAVIFGRVTYEMMVGYWPTAGDRPGATPHDVSYGYWVNRATKVVASRSLESASWGEWDNVQLVKDAASEIRRLKEQPGKNMNLIGSGELFHTLVQEGLVDEFQLHINPVVLGSGKPLFPDLKSRVNWSLSRHGRLIRVWWRAVTGWRVRRRVLNAPEWGPAKGKRVELSLGTSGRSRTQAGSR